MADLQRNDRTLPVELHDEASGFNATVNSDGSINTRLVGNQNTIDPNNSTTTPLNAGQTFPGTGTEVTQYAHVIVEVFTDQASAVNGFELQFSHDNTTWHIYETHTLTANEYYHCSHAITGRYARVVYTNGGTTQTSFSIQTTYKATALQQPIVDLDAVLEADQEAALNRAVITGQDENGVFRNVLVTPQGELEVKSSSKNITEQGKRFSVLSGTLTHSGTAETAEVLIRNPSGSGLELIVDRQFFSSLTASTIATFRLYAAPTVTAVGTTITPQSLLVGGAATSSMQFFTGPTISSNGTQIQGYTVDRASVVDENDGRIVVLAGNDLLVTVETGNGKLFAYNLTFTEEV